MQNKVYERALWVFNQVPSNGVETILDIGCFDAASTTPLLEKASTVVGIDLDTAGLKKGIELNHSVHLSCASAVRLPFASSSFDCVVFSETLEHIPVDLEGLVLQEIHRVLKPSSLLILTVPHAGLFQVLDSMNFRRNIRQLMRKFGLNRFFSFLKDTRVSDAKGHKHYTQTELQELLSLLFSIGLIEQTGLLFYPLSLLLGLLPKKILQWKVMAYVRKHMADWDYRHNFGSASYNIALVASAKSQHIQDVT